MKKQHFIISLAFLSVLLFCGAAQALVINCREAAQAWDLPRLKFLSDESMLVQNDEGLRFQLGPVDRQRLEVCSLGCSIQKIPVMAEIIQSVCLWINGTGTIGLGYHAYDADGRELAYVRQVPLVFSSPDPDGWRQGTCNHIILPENTKSVRPELLHLDSPDARISFTIREIAWGRTDEDIRLEPQVLAVPPLTDRGYLPFDRVIPSCPENLLAVTGCPGEYEPASLVVAATDRTPLEGVMAECSELAGPEGAVIPPEAIDIRSVICWYVAANDCTITDNHVVRNTRVLRPELLCHDSRFMFSDHTEKANYIKLHLPEGERWSCVSNLHDEYFVIPNDEGHQLLADKYPVWDARELQPMMIPAGELRQYFLTVKIPENAVPGEYNGLVTVKAGEQKLADLKIRIQVLPFVLPKPGILSSIYYKGMLGGPGNIGAANYSDSKNPEQYLAEMINLKNHGVDNPSIFMWWRNPEIVKTLLPRTLEIRLQAGMDNSELFIWGDNTGDPKDKEGFAKLGRDVQRVLEITSNRKYGVKKVYFYGLDEAHGSQLMAERPAWELVHRYGVGVYVAGYDDASQLVGDLLDVSVQNGYPREGEAEAWHKNGHRVLSYFNPQSGVEHPTVYRRNFGLLLWQYDYDGAMNHAYQACYGHPYNDFDAYCRDEVMAYPTADGVIDTLEWEGYREGIDDLRYLRKLQECLSQAAGNPAKAEAAERATQYLAELKKTRLFNLEPEEIRQEIIAYILELM